MKKICQKFITYMCLLALLINSFPPIVMAEIRNNKLTEPVIQEEVTETEEETNYKVEPKIVEEIIEKRTENQKHYKMSDGSVMASLYSEKIHYLVDGKYEEVDNELVEKDGRYTPKKGNPNISFSKENNSTNTVEIKYKDKTVKLGLKNAEKVKANLKNNKEVTTSGIFDLDLKNYNDKKLELAKGNNKIKYEEISNGIDLTYEVSNEKIKENIIIKNKKALQSVFEYNIDTAGLNVVQIEDNYIVLKDPNTNEELFEITSPYMYDAHGEYSDGLKISIKDNILKLELDEKWLEDEKRVYPITVDPTVNTTTVQWDIWDTYIYNGDTGVSWITRRDNPIIYGGSNWWAMFNGQPVRMLVRFPVLPALSSSDQVIDATFYLKGYPQHYDGWSYPSGQVQFNIHKMKTSWNHGVNDFWSSISGASNYDARVEDYILYSYSTSNPAPVYSADVTKMVQDWYTTGNNYGFVIKHSAEQAWQQQNIAWFYSSDIGTVSYRPKITISYINQSGLEGYLNYHEQNIGRTTVYTNDFNGNLILTHQDATTPGSRFPISVNHVFNTAAASTNIGFGNGFRLNLSQSIHTTGDATYPITYIDEDGTTHWFKQKSGFCEDEENLGLKIYGTPSLYTLVDKAGNVSYFYKLDSAVNRWYLTKITDTSNNEVNLTYSGTVLTTATDGAGDTISFGYNNNLLSTITDKAGRTLTYGYTNNQLTSITYPDNLTTQYTYDGNKIKQVTNVDNSKVIYDYYPGYNLARVSRISEYANDGVDIENSTPGNYLNITYGQKVTTFTDSDGNVNTETFNNLGNIISTSNFTGDITGDNVFGKTYTFGTSVNNKNRLIADTNLVKPTSNYLLNHNLESTSNWIFSQWGNNGAQASTFTVSANAKYFGSNGVEIISNDSWSAPFLSQQLYLPAGETYTLSGYIKTVNVVPRSEQYGSGLAVYFVDNNEQLTSLPTPKITGTNDWQRYEYTFTVPANTNRVLVGAIGLYSTGTTYIDGLQLEQGNIMNQYNLIQNGNFFHNDTAWGRTNLATGDTTQTINGNKIFKIDGSPTGEKNIYQVVYVSGKAGDTLSFAYWYKNLGVKNYSPASKFANIRANIVGADGSSNWISEEVGHNPDSSAWQMGNYIFTAPKDYQRIVIYVCFYRQANQYFVDNITLNKDVSGNSYVYDNNGNLTSTKSQDKTSEVITKSASGNLLNNISTTGSNFAYEYDYNAKDRLTRAINKNTNLEYNLSYDQYGNNTGMTITPDSVDELVNGTYYIRSKLSNRVIDDTGVATITNNLKMHQYQYVSHINQRMILTAIDDTYYKITTTRDTNKAFTVSSDNYLVVYDYSGADNQKWQLITHDDGTYEIISKSNNKAITVKDDIMTNAANYTISDRTNSISQRFTFEKEYDLNEFSIESGEVYRIRNKNSGLYLDYKNAGTYDKLYQEVFDESKKSQLWRVVQKDGYYKLYSLNVTSNKTFEIETAIDGENRDILAYPENGNTAQKWYLYNNLDGTFTFRTIFPSGRLLGVNNASTAPGEFIKLKTSGFTDDCKFYFEKVNLYDIEDGIYNISVNGLNFGVVDDGDVNNKRVQLQTPSSNLTQQWRITNLKNGYYTVMPAHTQNNMSLDISGAGTADGTAVQIYVLHSMPTNGAQQFEFVATKNGTYYIKPKHVLGVSALDVERGIIAPGTNIQLYTTIDYIAQQFKLTRIDEDTTPKIETKVEYSSDGNYQTKSIDQRGNETNYNYNTNTGTTTSVLDPKNNTVSYNYDLLNRITSVTSNNTTNGYVYTNDLLSQITHNGFNYNFYYNNFNNITNIKVNNQDLITNTYEPNNGNLLSSTYGNNDQVSFTYDTFNRLSTKVKQNNTYTYLYDNSNNLAVKKDTNNNTCKYIYDLASRIVEYKENDNYKINYKYDNRNNISKIDYTLNNLINTLNYSYDNDSKQLSYTINNNLVTYNYDLFSRLNKKEIGNYITTYEYLNLEENKTTTLLDTITNNDSEIRYVYDEVGNITKIYKDEVLENEYEYDSLNQLSLEKTYSLNQKIEYTYDNGGNILTKVYKNLDTDAIINTYSYSYDTNWKDQLINYNGNVITYDEIGNPLTYGNNITYSWINGRELETYTDTSNNLEVEYSYNDEGIRTSKIINGVEHKYYLEGTNIVYETIGENTLYYFYDSMGSIEGFKYNNDLYYYIKNGQNDIIGIIDDEGNQVVSYTYDSWGQIISITDNLGNEITDPTHIGNINPFRYRSYYYDSESELYYLNSRYYNPEMGRFINSDEFGGQIGELLSHNTYSYVANNPINSYDPTGHMSFAFPIFSKVIEAVAVAIVKTAVYVTATVVSVIAMKEAAISIPKTNTKVLADTKAIVPKKQEKVYQAAYVNTDTNKLETTGPMMNYDEALMALQITGGINAIVGNDKNITGIYTENQQHARALALASGISPEIAAPKVHNPGYWGHYHSNNRSYSKYHIWYGNPVDY